MREIGMPKLRVTVQPGNRTLVNARTIVYTTPPEFERTVTLLGTDVDLVAAPTRYTWSFGDGTSLTTTKPGRPYPAFDVTHRYRAEGENRRLSVTTTYQVRYRIDGGAWETLGQTLTAAGPATTIDVREAAPVLTRP